MLYMKLRVALGGLLILLSAATGLNSQTLPDFNRKSDHDVQHYILRVSFDRAEKQVIGDTTVILKPIRDAFRRVELDSTDISYRSVVLEPAGTPLKFSTPKDKVVVDLDRAYSTGETIALRFKYTAKPKKGVYFVEAQTADQALKPHSGQIWTQGEADEAHHWFPSFDFPSDKATVEQYITARSNEKVIGNGVLVEKISNADGTVTHHFKMDIPFSTYLVSFVIGEYAEVKDKHGDIPLGFYVYPGTESIVPKAFGRTGEMMRVFADVTGVPFPYNKYDQTVVSRFQFGGMENITATTLADTEVYMVESGLFEAAVVDLVAHELAHSWFGNLVTCKNWAELWLNEGFATFMEAVYREKAFGKGSYRNKILSDARQYLMSDAVTPKKHGLFNRNAGNIAELFDVPFTTYNKGGAVLHTLREEIGDEAFWKAVKIYLDRHRYGSVTTPDLRAAMEEASGRDLKWFFDQWVYGIGSPKLRIRPTYSTRNRTLTLAVSQTQKIEKFTPAAYKLPLEIEIPTNRGTVKEKLEIDQRVESFSFRLPAAPNNVMVVDKDEKIPLKQVTVSPLITRR